MAEPAGTEVSAWGGRRPVVGVRNPERLRAVEAADLQGHLGDADLDAIVATLRLACRADIAVVNIVTPDLQTYPAEEGVGAACTTVPDGLSFCSEVVETGRPLSVADAATHPVYGTNPLVLSGAIGAYAGVPLVDAGVVLGAVSLFVERAREFTPDELEILRHQSLLAGSVLALRRSARTDVLTGLPNRMLFLDRLQRALVRQERHGGHACVMYLDVDDFKGINDTYGHAGGDDVLVELGRRIGHVLRPEDTLSRFGGDEFVVLCEDLGGVRDAETLAARVVAAAEEPWQVRGKAAVVGVSVGVAITSQSGKDPTALLRDADTAMYAAKRLPGSAWVLASPRPVLDLRDAGGPSRG